MDRSDIERLVQVTHSLRGLVRRAEPLTEADFDQFIDRLLWAIHSSKEAPQFDVNRFVKACRGEDGLRVFPDDQAA